MPDRPVAEPARQASTTALDLHGRSRRSVLSLQRAVGNAAVVSRLLSIQRRAEDRAPTHRVIRYGSTGPDVADLQTRLNTDGAAPALVDDGIFGSLTRAAVVAFQGRHGLVADGIVGLRTWGILDALASAGVAGPVATLDGTRPVTDAQHDQVEQILHPNVTPGQAMPAMIGAGPGGSFETQMLAALHTLADETIAAVPGQADMSMGTAEDIGEAAQAEVEHDFGTNIVMASRRPNGSWHPGSSRMALADASTRTEGTAGLLGWLEYFMTDPTYPPAQVLRDHNVDTARTQTDANGNDVPDPTDRLEFTRVRDLFMAQGGRAKVDAMVRTWPAEAGTGTVYVQLRHFAGREGRWKLFTVLMHEFLHLVTHDNYERAAAAVGGSAGQILREGFTDHFRTQVWRRVLGTLAGNTALRQRVEGPNFVATPAPGEFAEGGPIDQIAWPPYDQVAEARQIAGIVGEDNARAAYFQGHPEFLGLGAGSRSEHPLTGIAEWRPGETGEPDRYVVPAPGQTLAQVQARTGSARITEADGTEVVDPTQQFAPGHVLIAEGIRWHTAIREDTRGQVASQNGLSQPRLEQANGWAPRSATTAIPAGTVVLIPARP